MKKKKEGQKKLSLEKLQLTKVINPRSIKGGGGGNTGLGLENGDDTRTDPTSPD
ncbi:hypothetical protein [Chryseobacterium sediminis]|uniref:Bacteriocin n=1 Tax=Chryseobacterium sediminis TaxID=1679494 RepID=A0ABR6Q2Y2_9FLAO|nr:hypothetical protein [Chryseobacterium sediminis]MBB6330889.1 hypothetical protein [Chryseobacterium sediminis]